jgi:integrase
MPVSINKRNVREALEPRREPYWGPQLDALRFLGFRASEGKPGSWIARARLNDELRERLKLTGAQTYKDLGPVTDIFDYAAACKAAHEWFATLDAGVVHNGVFTVEDACKEYVEDRRREKGDACADDAQWRFKNAVYDKPFGRTDLSKLRTPAIKTWRESLGMTKAGANRMMTSLRAALNLAVEHNRVAPNVAQAWRAVKQHKKADGRREIFLDLAQRRALLAAANVDVRTLLEAALMTGARPGEIAHVKRSAFDARTKTIKFSGKTGPRDVPLEGAALALFERLAKSKLPAAPLLTDKGQPWTKMEWSRQIRAAATAAVVTDDKGNPLKGNDAKLPAGIVLYTARHCYITQAITDGLTTLDVARLTGTSLKMIEENYGHLVQGAVRERLAKVQML